MNGLLTFSFAAALYGSAALPVQAQNASRVLRTAEYGAIPTRS